MKSCTDLGQSKKLSEILSLDSADMVITFDYINREYTQNKPIARPYLEFRTELLRYYDEEEADRRAVPCWSLAALLDVLPDSTDIVKDKADTENEKYMCTVGVKHDIISTFGNNPVDACYDMIIRLHSIQLL